MSYLVLARKWRPKTFEDVVGQDHVVRTLSHSLDNERLHHAYLFTGTRGVGKTTIARILAKALNCEKGVSPQPCGQCNTCLEVDQGSFIDLIEVDAASKTKVEDTRALLDNVPYLPTAGRYKIYLFDEIHMLSGHSFNAFLKTLEEPPAHVKFLMATTDPHKLPITVLSRCIQFNLRAMDTEEISLQLEKILPQENVTYEAGAIHAIARLSQGSMRDALSIVDQAISYAQGNLQEQAVREMLGMLSHDYVSSILQAVANGQTEELLTIVDKMFERSVNIESALDDLLLKLHDLGLHKVAPQFVESRSDNVDQLRQLSAALSAQEIQLYYQIGLLGKRDLEFAPTPRIGLEMVLLRMIAFHPDSAPVNPIDGSTGTKSSAPSKPSASSVASQSTPAASTTSKESPMQSGDILTIDDWLQFVETSHRLTGPIKNFAAQVSFESRKGNTIHLVAPENASASIMREENFNKVEQVLREFTGQNIELNVQKGTSDNTSLAEKKARLYSEAVDAAIQEVEQEDIPKILRQEFDAEPDLNSIRLPKNYSGPSLN